MKNAISTFENVGSTCAIFIQCTCGFFTCYYSNTHYQLL